MRINTQTHHYPLDSVKRRVEEGASIANTPHVGNAWVEDLYHHHDGANQADFFGNRSTKDTIDEPEYRIQGGDRQRLTHQNNVMTPYLRSEGNEIIGHMHFSARRDYLKGIGREQNHFTTHEYLFEREMSPFIIDIMLDLIRKGIRIFDRKINSNGIVTSYEGRQNEEQVYGYIEFANKKNRVITEGIDLELENGLVLDNRANVFLCILIEYLTQRTNGYTSNNVVLLSGPSMIKYVNNSAFLEFLQSSYDLVRRNFELPEEINVDFIPGSSFAFIPCSHELEIVDAFNNYIYPNMIRMKEIQRKLGTCSSDKRVLIDAMREVRGALNAAIEDIKPQYINRRITQYDLLSNGSHVTDLPEDVKAGYNYAELAKYFNTLV